MNENRPFASSELLSPYLLYPFAAIDHPYSLARNLDQTNPGSLTLVQDIPELPQAVVVIPERCPGVSEDIAGNSLPFWKSIQ
jgi:hypothetical protein